jgi:hypothetical protein
MINDDGMVVTRAASTLLMVYKRMGAFYSPHWLIVFMPYPYGWYVACLVRLRAYEAVPNRIDRIKL